MMIKCKQFFVAVGVDFYGRKDAFGVAAIVGSFARLVKIRAPNGKSMASVSLSRVVCNNI